MKNYFRQILTSFTKNHYSETIRQNFYGWLTDKEHAVEKDKALKEIWTTARAMGEVPHVEKELERWKRNNGLHTASSVPVTPNRKIRILRFWQSVAAVLLLAAVSLGYLVLTPIILDLSRLIWIRASGLLNFKSTSAIWKTGFSYTLAINLGSTSSNFSKLVA